MTATEKRYWDIPSILLLVAALWVVALRLWLTDWTANLERVEVLAMLGLILGLLLGRSLFSSSVVRWLAFLYSLVVLPWQVSHLDDSATFLLRFLIVNGRLGTTLATFFRNQPVQDAILFVASMCLLFWLVGMMAAYMLVRYNRPWVPLAVISLGVLLIEYYHPYMLRGSFLTATYMFFVLMLLGRLHFLANRQDWEENRVTVDSEAGFDLSRGTIATGLLLVVLAWNLPTAVKMLTPGTDEQRWVEVSWQGLRDRMSNMVASLQTPATTVSSDFGNHMALGNGATLGNENVLMVIPQEEVPQDSRFYWRGRSYDYYDAGGWTNSFGDIRDIAAGDPSSWKYPEWGPGVKVSMTFRYILGPGRTIYTPGLPISIDRDTKAQVQSISENQSDIVAILASEAFNGGEIYNLDAFVLKPTEAILRNTPTSYPDWISQYYLQLPGDFSPSVRRLAEQITAGLDTPYDKATAITQYLRDNIEYSTEIESPPPGADVLEWFLFDYKKGYCNYYATAEVTMLRSLGIPARMVNGFAEGDLAEDGKYYLVQRNDSHAWPEVFFPTVGWVPFEPTVSQPLYSIPAGEDPNSGAGQANIPGPSERNNVMSEDTFAMRDRERFEPDPEQYDGAFGAASQQQTPIGWILLATAVLAIAAFAYLRMRMVAAGRWRPLAQFLAVGLRRTGLGVPRWLQAWSRYTELSAIERIYAGIGWMVRFLGGKPRIDRSPFEQMDALVHLLPEGAQDAAVVLEQYQRSVYSRYPVDVESARQASNALWKQAARAWFRRRLRIEVQVS